MLIRVSALTSTSLQSSASSPAPSQCTSHCSEELQLPTGERWVDEAAPSRHGCQKGGQSHRGQQVPFKKTDRYHRHHHPRFQWFLDAYVCQALCEALHPDYLAAISQHAYEGSGCFPIEQVQRVRLGHPSGPVSLAALCSHFSMCLTRISQTVGSNSLQGSLNKCVGRSGRKHFSMKKNRVFQIHLTKQQQVLFPALCFGYICVYIHVIHPHLECNGRRF